MQMILSAIGSDTSTDEVTRMMKEIDTDEDGYINRQEFVAFCDEDFDPHQSPEKELRDVFELYDQDHDGKISASELHKILMHLGEHLSEQDCGGMIKSVDSDGDGHVCFEELTKMMTKNKGAK